MPTALPDHAAVLAAAARIAPYAHRTPVLTSASLDALAGAQLLFKCENLQRVGAFKFRGACNAVFALDDATAARGVVTHSSGNHGAALAGAQLLFKCENLQRVGAFKFRGACNAVFALDDATAARGVVTHSSGNHGAALALAARVRGIPAHVVVPEGAVPGKVAAIAAA